MMEPVSIRGYRPVENGTEIKVFIPKDVSYMFKEKSANKGEIRIDDGRTISAEQRRKAYATIGDIAEWNGDVPENVKLDMKWQHMTRSGCGDFSLSDCSMDTAREFINTLIEFCLEFGVPLTEQALNRTDDIGRYLYFCLKHRKCAVCGRDGEIHHWDAIGMGNDRRKTDDSEYRKICLCRTHHALAHQRGNAAFEHTYKVYGIKYKETE